MGKSFASLVLDNSNMINDEQEQLLAAVEMLIGEDILNFEANEHVLPHELESNIKDRPISLEVGVAPIEDQNGRIQHLLVAIKDVTELRTIQEEARKEAGRATDYRANPQTFWNEVRKVYSVLF